MSVRSTFSVRREERGRLPCSGTTFSWEDTDFLVYILNILLRYIFENILKKKTISVGSIGFFGNICLHSLHTISASYYSHRKWFRSAKIFDFHAAELSLNLTNVIFLQLVLSMYGLLVCCTSTYISFT